MMHAVHVMLEALGIIFLLIIGLYLLTMVRR
jgi:hypothetical protein